MRRVHPRLLRTLLLLAAALIVPEGCSREETGALPPKKDLYRYALAVAERARGLANPDAYLPLYHVGKVHQQFGMEDVALEYYRRALKLDPDAYEVYRDMGFILSQRQGEGRLREAVEAYQQSLLRNEAQKGIFTRIGLVLTHQGSLSRAVAALTHEIRRGTADAFTYYNLGQAYKQQNDNRKAVEHYRKALDMEPGLREALYGLSQSLKVLGHEEEADQYLDRFQALRDEHQERELEPRTDKTDRDELVGHAAEAWVRAAEVFAIEAGRSEAQARRRFSRHALHAMEEVLKLDGRNEAAHRFLVDTHRKQQPAKALEFARRAVEARPEDAPLLHDVARLHLELAPRSPPDSPGPEVDEAVEILERLVRLAPDSAVAHLELARTILFRKRQRPLMARALSHAKRALELAKEPVPLNYDLIAMAHTFSDNPAAALATMREGVRRFPGDAGLRSRLQQLEGRSR